MLTIIWPIGKMVLADLLDAVAPNLQFVKNAVLAKCNKAKCNKRRYACTFLATVMISTVVSALPGPLAPNKLKNISGKGLLTLC